MFVQETGLLIVRSLHIIMLRDLVVLVDQEDQEEDGQTSTPHLSELLEIQEIVHLVVEELQQEIQEIEDLLVVNGEKIQLERRVQRSQEIHLIIR